MKKLLKIAWGVFAPLAVIIACNVSNASTLESTTAILGVLFVIGVAYKIPETNLLGMILCVLVGVMSYKVGYITNAIVNCVVLMPLQLAAYLEWRGFRVVNDKVKGFILKYRILITTAMLSVYFYVSLAYGGSLPSHDSLSSSLVIMATLLLMIKAKEQWNYWLLYNGLEVIMWFIAVSLAPEMMSILAMRIIFFINSIIGFFEWRNHGRFS